MCRVATFTLTPSKSRSIAVETRKDEKQSKFRIEKLEERIAPAGQSHFPPGQFPAGNPAQAPGNSNSPGNSK